MPAVAPRTSADPWESVLSAATRKGVSRHAVLIAAAARLLRSRYVAGRLVLRRADVDAWDAQTHANTSAA